MSSDVTVTDTRPPFRDIWRKHDLRVHIVANKAKVPLNTIYAMLYFNPVERHKAESVMTELNRLCEQSYTLETVRVKLKGDDHATV